MQNHVPEGGGGEGGRGERGGGGGGEGEEALFRMWWN